MNMLHFVVGILGRINKKTLFFCRYATITLVALITVVVCAGVYWRYVLNNSLSWTEETAKFLMVWMVFTGIPIALKNGGHAAIDALPNALPARGRQALYALIYLVVLLLMVVLVYQGWAFAWNARVQNTATTQISMMYVFGAMPVGGAIMFFVSLELLLQAIIGVFKPSEGIHLQDIEMAKASAE